MLYIETNSISPYYNFAVEYYFLKEKKLPQDIFMLWRTTSTLMVGKYQNTREEINEQYVKEKGYNVVRRLTGGGTIYTDLNGWQFSFIMYNKKYDEVEFAQSAKPIVDALKSFDLDVCFSGRNDILLGGKKISGNAMHADKNGVLHHGSLLYDTDIDELVKSITVSDQKIISKGIKSIRQRVTNIADYLPEKLSAEEFKELLLKEILKESVPVYTLTEEDKKRIEELELSIFKNWEWTYGNNPEHQITKSHRFAGGLVSCSFDIKNENIYNVNLVGDFICNQDLSIITNALEGCRYRKEEITQSLVSCTEDVILGIANCELVECIL